MEHHTYEYVYENYYYAILDDSCELYLGIVKQGKSEGFESCDRPIVRKRPIWVKIGDV